MSCYVQKLQQSQCLSFTDNLNKMSNKFALRWKIISKIDPSTQFAWKQINQFALEFIHGTTKIVPFHLVKLSMFHLMVPDLQKRNTDFTGVTRCQAVIHGNDSKGPLPLPPDVARISPEYVLKYRQINTFLAHFA